MPIEEKTEQREADEKVVEIELERLRSFANHPFKVQADSQMIELQDSIRKYGIFACVVTSLRGPAFIGYDSNAKMYLIIAVCFGVTALWGIISWHCIIKK